MSEEFSIDNFVDPAGQLRSRSQPQGQLGFKIPSDCSNRVEHQRPVPGNDSPQVVSHTDDTGLDGEDNDALPSGDAFPPFTGQEIASQRGGSEDSAEERLPLDEVPKGTPVDIPREPKNRSGIREENAAEDHEVPETTPAHFPEILPTGSDLIWNEFDNGSIRPVLSFTGRNCFFQIPHSPSNNDSEIERNFSFTQTDVPEPGHGSCTVGGETPALWRPPVRHISFGQAQASAPLTRLICYEAPNDEADPVSADTSITVEPIALAPKEVPEPSDLRVQPQKEIPVAAKCVFSAAPTSVAARAPDVLVGRVDLDEQSAQEKRSVDKETDVYGTLPPKKPAKTVTFVSDEHDSLTTLDSSSNPRKGQTPRFPLGDLSQHPRVLDMSLHIITAGLESASAVHGNVTPVGVVEISLRRIRLKRRLKLKVSDVLMKFRDEESASISLESGGRKSSVAFLWRSCCRLPLLAMSRIELTLRDSCGRAVGFGSRLIWFEDGASRRVQIEILECGVADLIVRKVDLSPVVSIKRKKSRK